MPSNGKVFHPNGKWGRKKKRPTHPVSEEARELETEGANEEG